MGQSVLGHCPASGAYKLFACQEPSHLGPWTLGENLENIYDVAPRGIQGFLLKAITIFVVLLFVLFRLVSSYLIFTHLPSFLVFSPSCLCFPYVSCPPVHLPALSISPLFSQYLSPPLPSLPLLYSLPAILSNNLLIENNDDTHFSYLKTTPLVSHERRERHTCMKKLNTFYFRLISNTALNNSIQNICGKNISYSPNP